MLLQGAAFSIFPSHTRGTVDSLQPDHSLLVGSSVADLQSLLFTILLYKLSLAFLLHPLLHYYPHFCCRLSILPKSIESSFVSLSLSSRLLLK